MGEGGIGVCVGVSVGEGVSADGGVSVHDGADGAQEKSTNVITKIIAMKNDFCFMCFSNVVLGDAKWITHYHLK